MFDIEKTMVPILFVVDTSENMSEKNLTVINDMLTSFFKSLKEDKKVNKDVSVGILKYANNAEWVTNYIEPIENVMWNNVRANGTSNLEAAIDEILIRGKSKELYGFNNEREAFNPILVFISGTPTSNDIENKIKQLKDSDWFETYCIFGLTDETNSNVELLEFITGNTETIFSLSKFFEKNILINLINQMYENCYYDPEDETCEKREYEIVQWDNYDYDMDYSLVFPSTKINIDKEKNIEMCLCESCSPNAAFTPVLNVKHICETDEYLEIKNIALEYSLESCKVEYLVKTITPRTIKNNEFGFSITPAGKYMYGTVNTKYDAMTDTITFSNNTSDDIYVSTCFAVNDIIYLRNGDRILKPNGEIIFTVEGVKKDVWSSW